MIKTAPDIDVSTKDERRDYIRDRYPCLSDCDMCGLCKVFHGQNPENAYREYIAGLRSFDDVTGDYR